MKISAIPGRLAKSLLALAMLSTVAACGERVNLTSFPPAEDVRVEAEPAPWPEVFADEEQASLYDSAHDAWALRGWAMIGRVCRDAVRKGAEYPDNWCPPEPVPPPD